MRIRSVLVGFAALLALACCANPPSTAVKAARDAVTALDAGSDIRTYAPEAVKAARDALAALDAELAAQAARGTLSRRYETARSLAAEAARLAGAAADQARSAREEAERRQEDMVRLTEIVRGVDERDLPPPAGSAVGEVWGGDIEYLADSDSEAVVAFFDAGYPDTGGSEGYTPAQRLLIYDLPKVAVAETVEVSREDALRLVTERGYTMYGGERTRSGLRFVARIGGQSIATQSIELYMIDDSVGVGMLMHRMRGPEPTRGDALAEVGYSIAPDECTMVVMLRRPSYNEWDAGDDIAVVVGRDAVLAFLTAVARARFDLAAALAAKGDESEAVGHLVELQRMNTAKAEELLAVVRNDPEFDPIRSGESFADFLRNAYPGVSRHGLDERYVDEGCGVARTRLEGTLDAASLSRYEEGVRDRILEGANGAMSFAGECVVVEWGCGTGCQSGVVINLRDGSIHDLPVAEQGYEYRKDSRLLIVNPVSWDDEDYTWFRRAVPSYYRWTGTDLELLCDVARRWK
jgi:hypothetical protein